MTTEFEDALTRYGVACLNYAEDQSLRTDAESAAALDRIKQARAAVMTAFDVAALDKAKSLITALSSH